MVPGAMSGALETLIFALALVALVLAIDIIRSWWW